MSENKSKKRKWSIIEPLDYKNYLPVDAVIS